MFTELLNFKKIRILYKGHLSISIIHTDSILSKWYLLRKGQVSVFSVESHRAFNPLMCTTAP